MLKFNKPKILMCYLLFISLSLIGVTTVLQAYPNHYNNRHLKNKIDQLIHNEGTDLNIGIVIYNLDKHQLLYERNSKRLFHPASNAKLFNVYAIVNELGLDFRYQTQMYTDAEPIKDNVLNGNVYIKFSGDPTLTIENLKQLLSNLSAKGIHTIKGKVFLDDTYFDQNYWEANSGHDDSLFDYGALVSAINIDKNTIQANLLPTQEGKLASLELNLSRYPVKIINNVITSSTTDCLPKLKATEENIYYLSGCIEKPLSLKIAVQNMKLFAPIVVNNILNSLEIKVMNGIEFQKINSKTNLVANHQSATSGELINIMLKDSDNLIANALFKTLAAHRELIPASWENASKILQSYLDNILVQDSYRLWDGAGGSYDFISPDHVITLLKAIAYDKKLSDIFYDSLPEGGIDGTLKDRFTAKRYHGRVFAKTGSAPLSGHSSLSGYLITYNKQHLAFTILINGFIHPIEKYRQLEDDICQYLIDHY